MAKIIHTTDKIVLTAENEAHLQAVAAKFGWSEIKDIHIYTPIEQPSSPEAAAWAEPKSSASWLSVNVPLRDFVESPNFRHDFEMFRRNYPDMDYIYEVVKEVLLDRPSIGETVNPFPDFRRYLTEPIGETPSFWILYSYDIEHIHLHAIAKQAAF